MEQLVLMGLSIRPPVPIGSMAAIRQTVPPRCRQSLDMKSCFSSQRIWLLKPTHWLSPSSQITPPPFFSIFLQSHCLHFLLPHSSFPRHKYFPQRKSCQPLLFLQGRHLKLFHLSLPRVKLLGEYWAGSRCSHSQSSLSCFFSGRTRIGFTTKNSESTTRKWELSLPESSLSYPFRRPRLCLPINVFLWADKQGTRRIRVSPFFSFFQHVCSLPLAVPAYDNVDDKSWNIMTTPDYCFVFFFSSSSICIA